MPPRVFRRTPVSEEAAMYGYKDLLKDSISLLQEKARANVARMTGGGMTGEELQEIALAPVGGMLKVAGTGKLLAGLLKSQAQRTFWETAAMPSAKMARRASEGIHAPGRKVFREALKVPEKEYGRIKDISWKIARPSYKGEYDPHFKSIRLNPRTADIETVWHEFTHARQWSPEKYAPMPTGGGTEAEKAFELRDLVQRLTEVARKSGMSGEEFYFKVSPIERHARGVAKYAVESPRHFDVLYKYALKSEVARSKRKLTELLSELPKEIRNKMGHYLEGD